MRPWGPSTVPLACMPCGSCVPRAWRGAVPGAGRPCTVVRGVLCQLPPLSRPPVFWAGRPGFRDPCVPGAVGAGVGTQHRPHSVRPCELSLRAAGVAEGRPRGGALRRCERRLRPGAPPPSGCPPSGRAVEVCYPRAVGAGVRVWGPALSPWLACPVADTSREGGGGPSPGGSACHRCEGRLVSGAVPPSAARPLGRAAGVPRPMCPGCGWCGCGDPAPAPQPSRGGGRASPGRGAFRRCEGRLRSGAPPRPAARPLGGLSGSATHVLLARVCGCGGPALSPWPACPVGAACRGGVGAVPGGVACHRCEGRLVSCAVPPLAALPLGRAAGVL